MSSTSTPAFPGHATLTTYVGGKDAPVLEVGELSPAIIDDFCSAADTFFRKSKVIDEHEKVVLLLNSFRDPHIDSWLKNSKAKINADTYTFDSFMSDIWKRFLPPTWAMDLYRTEVTAKMQNKRWDKFVTGVVRANNQLEGHTLHKTHDELRTILEGNMADYLADALAALSDEEQEKISAKEDFYDWDAEIRHVDK